MTRAFKMDIGRKIYGIIAICFLGFAGVLTFMIFELNTDLQGQRRQELKHLTEAALAIVAAENASAQKGDVSTDAAQKRAAAAIGELRYGNNDYFWINDMHPRMVMHPMKPELNGRDLSQIKDPNGMALFVAFVDEVKRNGAGFVDYKWPRPDSDEPQPKMSYVKGFAPWGWIVGTGVYVDDLKSQVRKSAI